MMTEPLPPTCPHCQAGRASLYADLDGAACLVCGWHYRSEWCQSDRQPEPDRKSHRRRASKGDDKIAA